MDALREAGAEVLSPFEQKIVARRIRAFRRGGAPNDIAPNLAVLSLLTTACDLADLAKAGRTWPIAAAALLYHQAGSCALRLRPPARRGGAPLGDSGRL